MADEKFAVFFPEKAGYLYCGPLGKGAQSATMIVRSLVDHRDYVRKKTRPDMAMNDGIDCPEVSLYKPHHLVPKMYHSEKFSVLPECHQDYDKFQSLSMIFQYCNGGTLGRFLNVLKKAEFAPSESLLWHMLNQFMEVLLFLHRGPKPLIHDDLHPHNVFLHFSTDRSRLPDFYIGDFGCARPLPENSHEPSRTPDIGSREMRGIYTDWVFVFDVMQELISRRQPTDRNGNIDWAAPPRCDPSLTPAFVDSWKAFGNIVKGMLNDPSRMLEELGANHATVSKCADISRSCLRYTTDYNWTRQDRYFHLDLPAAEQLCRPAKVVLFDSRHDLLQRSQSIPGPWRIARVNPNTMQVVSVEKLSFGLHLPQIKLRRSDIYWTDYNVSGSTFGYFEDSEKIDNLVKTEVDHIGMGRLLLVAKALEDPNNTSLVAFFEEDAILTERAALSGQEQERQSFQICPDTQDAENVPSGSDNESTWEECKNFDHERRLLSAPAPALSSEPCPADGVTAFKCGDASLLNVDTGKLAEYNGDGVLLPQWTTPREALCSCCNLVSSELLPSKKDDSLQSTVIVHEPLVFIDNYFSVGEDSDDGS